jgi:DNA-binding transcriptional ArsR family regulator
MNARRRSDTAVPRARRASLGRHDGGDRDLDRVFATVARYFLLLSEPTRLKILHAICRSEQSVSAIVSATQATQSTVSRHLGMLHRAGVVSRRRDRNEVRYRIADPAFIEVCRSVCVQIASRIEERAPLRDELLDFAARH